MEKRATKAQRHEGNEVEEWFAAMVNRIGIQSNQVEYLFQSVYKILDYVTPVHNKFYQRHETLYINYGRVYIVLI